MKVQIQELKQACEIILSHLEEHGCSEIELDRDWYWSILSREDLYANNTSPEIGVGSLRDDLEGLEKVLDGTHPVSTSDLDRLGNIFIAISDKIAQ